MIQRFKIVEEKGRAEGYNFEQIINEAIAELQQAGGTVVNYEITVDNQNYRTFYIGYEMPDAK